MLKSGTSYKQILWLDLKKLQSLRVACFLIHKVGLIITEAGFLRELKKKTKQKTNPSVDTKIQMFSDLMLLSHLQTQNYVWILYANASYTNCVSQLLLK